MQQQVPGYVEALQAAYGPPSETGFGSAVFFVASLPVDGLEAAALEHYRRFVGKGWSPGGDDSVWINPWKEVYRRNDAAARDIVTELEAITDPAAKLSVPMILDVVTDPAPARRALAAAMDDPAVEALSVYNLGDGAALSGLEIAARRSNGEAVFLVFLLD